MKSLLLLLLLPLTLSAEVERCGTKSIANIEACTVEDRLPQLMKRLYPTHSNVSKAIYTAKDPCDSETIDNEETEEVEVCPKWNPTLSKYYYSKQDFDEDDIPQLSFYQRLVVEKKLPLEDFNKELLLYSEELKVVVRWRERVKGLKYFRQTMSKCGYKNPNASLFRRELLNSLNDDRVICLESKVGEIEKEALKDLEIKKIEKDIRFGERLIINTLFRIRNLGVEESIKVLKDIEYVNRLLKLGKIKESIIVLGSVSASPTIDFLINRAKKYTEK